MGNNLLVCVAPYIHHTFVIMLEFCSFLGQILYAVNKQYIFRESVNLQVFFSDMDSCSSSPCKNDAPCTNIPDDFSCACTPGWSGKQCDVGEVLFFKMIQIQKFHKRGKGAFQ